MEPILSLVQRPQVSRIICSRILYFYNVTQNQCYKRNRIRPCYFVRLVIAIFQQECMPSKKVISDPAFHDESGTIKKHAYYWPVSGRHQNSLQVSASYVHFCQQTVQISTNLTTTIIQEQVWKTNKNPIPVGPSVLGDLSYAPTCRLTGAEPCMSLLPVPVELVQDALCCSERPV